MTRLFIAVLVICNGFVALAQNMAPNPQTKFISNARQLIYEGKRSGEGYFNSDGTKLVFQSERNDSNPFYQIYELDLTTGDIRQVSDGIGKTTCAYFNWANDNEILYASTHLDPQAKEKMQEELDFRASGKKRRYSWDYDPTMDIFVTDKDGNTRQVTNAKGYDAEGSFSPDGKKILFCSNRSAYEGTLSAEDQKRLEYDPAYFGELYIMNADGSNVKRLTNTPGYDGGPFFSPDGKRIIWRRFTPDGMQADIYTMNVDGSDVKQITDFKAMSWAPYIYPSGQYVIFASNKLGFDNFELYLVDIEGKKEPVRITYSDGFDGLPVFSPDGKHIVWTSTHTNNGQSQLFYGDWNNDAAMAALASAPFRGAKKSAFLPQVLAPELKAKVTFLSSDSLEGRMTGSAGIKEAAAYITDEVQTLGLKPLTGLDGYTQSFPFIADLKVEEKKTKLEAFYAGSKKGDLFELYKDYIPASFSLNGDVKADVVFAGYGLRTPGTAVVQYDSYSGVDVKDKIVVVLRGEPESLSEEDQKEVIRYSSFRYKSMVARELGAAGIIMIDLYDKTFKGIGNETTPGNMGIVAALVNPAVANQWFAKNGTTLDAVKKSLLKYNPHQASAFEIKDLTLELHVDLTRVKKEDVNIFAMLPASKPTDDYILIGAHYDHLGFGETGSRATDAEKHFIHNGADDNASGTATLLELAEYLTDLKKKQPYLFTKNIVFVWWSGEELGLVGSNYFKDNPPLPLKNFKAYLNFDMVGRLRDNKLILQGLGSSEGWKGIVERKNVVAGFQLSLQDDPYVPTDGMSMYQAGMPTLCFFTGMTEEYHTPEDDVETLNFNGMARVTDFAILIIKELLKPDLQLDYAEVSMEKTRSSSGFSVYLGTIPDYAAEVEGVKLSGVRADGPADKAGIKGGDIIVGLAGKTIGNIYDYTYALGDLVPDVEVDMIVMRDGKKLTLKVTPVAK